MAITTYQLPQDQAKLDAFKSGKVTNVDYHEWHDPFKNVVTIYTDNDIPTVEVISDEENI